MKLGVKKAFLCLMLIVTACLFSGCAWLSSSFRIELTNVNQENIYVDMLLPFDTDDEFYTDYNSNPDNSTMPVLDKNCELAKYSEDGYRSMFIHYNGSELSHSVSIDDFASGHISLPRALYEADHTPYGENAFMDFCKKYKKCRFAAFDEKGNILCVSKEVKLKKFPDSYMNYTTEWDIEKNKIKPKYKTSVDYLCFLVMMWLCTVACLILQLILNAIYNVMYRKGIRKCTVILVLSGVCTAVSVISSLCWLLIIGIWGFRLNPLDFFGSLFTLVIYLLPNVSLVVNVIYFKNFVTDMEIRKKSDTIE